VIKFLISIFLIFFLHACEPIKKNKITQVIKKSETTVEQKITKKNTIISNEKKNNSIFYLIGDPYFIEGVKYVPEENYQYSEVGLATFYGKELHNVKTVNNDLNKVTELLGRHKILPLPSIVKLTNLENGFSITIKIIDRFDDNGSIIQVSRKVAQLLGFYKNQLAKVRVEIIPEASKQWKNVTNSMNEPKFNETVKSAPTEIVNISNIDDIDENKENNLNFEQPIELNSEPIEELNLFLIVKNFDSYQEIQSIIADLDIESNFTSESIGSKYNLILGPISNTSGNKLVSTFILKGYKDIKLILE